MGARVATASGSRIDSLTAIRIFAATAVFLLHLPAPAYLPTAVRTFMSNGYYGVSLFFMLSGFVLAWSYADRILPLTGTSVWDFFVARFARIYPLYLFALLIVLVPTYFATGYKPAMWEHIFALQAWSGNVANAFGYNGPGWSLSVEVFLYATFPIAIVFLARAKQSVLLSMIVLSIAASFAFAIWMTLDGQAALPSSDPASAHRWLYRTPTLRLFDFVIGISAALLVRMSTAPKKWMSIAAQVAGLVGILWIQVSPSTNGTALSWDAEYQIPALLLIWGLATGPRLAAGRFFAARPLVVAGEASYAFYLLHVPLLQALPLAAATRSWQWGVLAVGLFVIILLLSIGAHIAIELPAQQWLRKILSARKPASKRVEHAPGFAEVQVTTKSPTRTTVKIEQVRR